MVEDGLLEDLPLPRVLDGLLDDGVHRGQDWRRSDRQSCDLTATSAGCWLMAASLINDIIPRSQCSFISTEQFLRSSTQENIDSGLLLKIKSKELHYRGLMARG